MAIAALVTWLITAVGGFVMLGKWIGGGGHRRESGSRLPAGAVFGHFALAALGLVAWIAYVATDNGAIAWTGVVLLLPVALLGFVMFARWVPAYRAKTAGTASGAETSFPVPIVVGHGLIAVVTVVLALLAALGL